MDEKWLAYAPGNLLGRVRELALAKTAAAHVPEDEPSVRDHGDLGWDDEHWATARREPWHAAAYLAQQEVRMSHPKTTVQFPRGDEGDRMVGHLLQYADTAGPASAGPSPRCTRTRRRETPTLCGTLTASPE